MIQDTMIQAALRAVAYLPLCVLRFLGAIVGLWWGYVPGRRWHVALTNLRTCYPGREEMWYQSTARKSLIEEGRNYFEMPHLWAASPARIVRYTKEFRGMEKLDRARKDGRPVLLITPHLGNWEFCSLRFALDHPLASMYRPLKSPVLDAYVRQGRAHTGAKLVTADRAGIRTLLDAMRSGYDGGILPDHTPKHPDDGVLAPFFGQPAMTSVLVSRLATKLDAVVFIVVAVRCRGGFAVRLLDVHPHVYATDRDTAAAGINASIEKVIDEAVTQYWWSYPRFRKRHMEPPSIY